MACSSSILSVPSVSNMGLSPCVPAGYIQKIKSGEEDFESLASQFSDCSSAKARGDLGAFSRGGQEWTPTPSPFPVALGVGRTQKGKEALISAQAFLVHQVAA